MWRVPGFRLPVEQAARVLARLPSRQDLPPNIRHADDLLFFLEAHSGEPLPPVVKL